MQVYLIDVNFKEPDMLSRYNQIISQLKHVFSNDK